MYDRIRPIAIRLLRGDTLRLEARGGFAWTATAAALTEDGNEPFIESDAFEVARAIVVMELNEPPAAG
jgi:hypothetical protein